MSGAVRAVPGDPDDIARELAPIVALHPDDTWAPCDPAAFLTRSELRFRRGDKSSTLAGGSAKPIDPARLGIAAAGDAYATPARRGDRPFLAWELTRPYSKSTGRLAELGEGDGYELVYDNRKPRKALANVPMFYEWQGRTTLVYWWFLAGSALPARLLNLLAENIVRAPADLQPPVTRGGRSAAPPIDVPSAELARETLRSINLGEQPEALPRAWNDMLIWPLIVASLARGDEVHQGDWEGVSVHFKNGKPAIVELHQHGKPAPVPVGQLETSDGRWVVACARGSHSTVSTRGDPGGEDVPNLGNGIRWEPKNVVDATAEPWYGFGGSWGKRRLGSLGNLGGILRAGVRKISDFDIYEESTGPLGPSRYKIR